MNVGKAIQEIAKRKGMSIRHLAAESGVSEATLYSWTQKSAKRRNPSRKNLQKVVAVLGVPTEEIFLRSDMRIPADVYAKWCSQCIFRAEER